MLIYLLLSPNMCNWHVLMYEKVLVKVNDPIICILTYIYFVCLNTAFKKKKKLNRLFKPIADQID